MILVVNSGSTSLKYKVFDQDLREVKSGSFGGLTCRSSVSRLRLKEQILDTKEYISILDKKLLNESFVRNAPKNLVHEEMKKKEQAKQKLEKLKDKLKNIS